MNKLTEITNYVQIADDIGTSGQPSPAQFADIAAAGFAAVINLAMPDSDHAIAEEGSIVTGHGMAFVHIPVDFAAPTATDLKRFIGVMQAFEGTRVWVHCVVNARVSAFCYHYLSKVRELPEAACRSPILEKWTPQMDDVWREFLAIDTETIANS